MPDLPPIQLQTSLPPLPARPADGHKGTFGRVLLIGGSPGMSGALRLSGIAALRSGSGLVQAAASEQTISLIAASEPCLMTVALAADLHGLRPPAAAEISTLLNRQQAVGCGPGLGTCRGAQALVQQLLTQAAVPLVLDADALNLCAEHKLLPLRNKEIPCVITPHPGEFARLTGHTTAQISQSRPELAREFALLHKLVVVLKGPQTIVTDGTRYYLNQTGNSGMATGGSGDVLTGITTSLLGQGIEAFAAAAIAVHVHGIAGDLAAQQLSPRGMIASDLLTWLPGAWKQIPECSESR